MDTQAPLFGSFVNDLIVNLFIYNYYNEFVPVTNFVMQLDWKWDLVVKPFINTIHLLATSHVRIWGCLYQPVHFEQNLNSLVASVMMKNDSGKGSWGGGY